MTKISPTLHDKFNGFTKAKIELRQHFLECVTNKEFRQTIQLEKAPLFHEALITAEENGLIHHTRLSIAIGSHYPAATFRWFASEEKRVTPGVTKRLLAVGYMAKIIDHDITRLTNGLGAIGHKLIMEYPELGFPKFDGLIP